MSDHAPDVGRELVPPPSQEIEGGASSRNKQLQKISETIKKEVTDDTYHTVATICRHIVEQGLKVDDACVLANIEPADFRIILKHHPLIHKLIHMKELEFKGQLLQPIIKKGRSDDKTAMWLLASRYPNEYGAGRGRQTETSEDNLAVAISIIQEEGDNHGLVKKSSRQAVITSTSGVDVITKKLKDFLV